MGAVLCFHEGGFALSHAWETSGTPWIRIGLLLAHPKSNMIAPGESGILWGSPCSPQNCSEPTPIVERFTSGLRSKPADTSILWQGLICIMPVGIAAGSLCTVA